MKLKTKYAIDAKIENVVLMSQKRALLLMENCRGKLNHIRRHRDAICSHKFGSNEMTVLHE